MTLHSFVGRGSDGKEYAVNELAAQETGSSEKWFVAVFSGGTAKILSFSQKKYRKARIEILPFPLPQEACTPMYGYHFKRIGESAAARPKEMDVYHESLIFEDRELCAQFVTEKLNQHDKKTKKKEQKQ